LTFKTSSACQRAVVVAILAACAALVVACGDDGGGTSDPTPPSSSPPAAGTENPCPLPRASVASVDGARPAKASQPTRVDPRSTLADILARHQEAQRRVRPLATASPVASADVGEIAVIQDEGDLVTPPNTFDLQGIGLRFTPRGGGYDVSRLDGSFQSVIGDPITLQDDDSVSQTMSFNFTFYGVARNTAFVNSDGNITFVSGDNASTARSVGRMLTGSPRVGPFFADLDPSDGGGVYVRSGTDAFTVTWCDVPVFDSPRRTRFQTSLMRDGTIEMKFAASTAWTAVDGITAISPGGTNNFSPVDLSATGSSGATGGAVGERFAARPNLDLVSLGRKFYTTHADLFDQLVVWTDQVMTPEGAFAFESTVSNTITGIGVDIFDSSRTFNSAGRLSSVVQMDALSKYPEEPATRFLGENSTLSVMGQEVGHRWLAYLRFSDHNRQPSEALLGRDSSHWSFFFDSDASVMEGNRIQDLGGGSFRTVAAVEKYSLLDQYAMGLVRDLDVPKMFYVESPVSTTSTAESAPRVGVTFTGTRRDVLINDIIEVMGARSPSADNSPKVIRQAFVYVVSRNRTADPSAIAKIDRFRRAWEPFYAQATGNRGTADTRLQQPGS
jgi:hypothetical protein